VRSVYQSTALNKAVKLSEALVPCQSSASGLARRAWRAELWRAPGTHRLRRAGLGERRIDSKSDIWKSSRLRQVIFACDRAHPALIAPQASDGYPALACPPEAMRTQVLYH